MPYFDYDGDIHVDVDDFLSACDSDDIKEIIKSLVEDGHLPESVLGSPLLRTNGASVSEYEYEEALDKLRGNYTRMTREEEEIIIKISKRF